jgi:rubrerythrin
MSTTIIPPTFSPRAAHDRRVPLKTHCAIPDVQVGAATLPLFGYWCGACDESFYIDHKPEFCPACGAHFN